MNKKTNWFSRIIIIFLIIFIVGIIIMSFGFGDSKFTLTNEILGLILLLIVLTLSEVFDNFTIGNLITAKKEKQEKESELKRISTENKELRNQLITVISNSITNRNMNVFGFSKDDLIQVVGVEQAEAEAVDEKKSEEDLPIVPKRQNDDYMLRRKMLAKIENLVLNNFCRQNKIPLLSVVKEVKFSEEFIGIDPIMDRNIIFDSYYKSLQSELFIEIKFDVNSMSVYSLYYMLSKVYYYRKANQLQAKVILIIPILPSEYLGVRIFGGNEYTITRIQKQFAPAIKNNLLEIVPVEVSNEELNIIKKEIDEKGSGE